MKIETELHEIALTTLNDKIIGDTLPSYFDNPNLGRSHCF